MKLLRPMKLCHESLKLKTSGTLLGLNVSKKYVDVSISDASKKVAAPLTVLVRTKKNVGLVGDFQSLISEFSVSGLVIGYPFEMEEGGRFTGLQVRRFVEDLAKTGKFEDMNYTFWNVNSESKIVAPMLQTLGWDWYRIMAYVDQYAALEFLQEYLDYVNQSKDETFLGCPYEERWKNIEKSC